MDGAPSTSDYGSLEGSSRREIEDIFGTAKRMRFSGGEEVWAYDYGPAGRPLGQTEVVVLFNPAGVVTKARLRPAP
jgi:hypothetical protein